MEGGGQGEKEAEVYRRWETRILKVAESGINKEKSHNILQYLAIKQVQRSGSQQLKISGGGDERYRKWEAQTPCPPPSPPPRSRCKTILIILRADRQVVMQEMLFRALFIS